MSQKVFALAARRFYGDRGNTAETGAINASMRESVRFSGILPPMNSTRDSTSKRKKTMVIYGTVVYFQMM